MKPLLDKLLKKCGYVLLPAHRITRAHFFDAYFSRVPNDFFFVQIGAGDGRLADPLYPYITARKLTGVAVEPLPSAFRVLEETYREFPGVRLVNAAVAPLSGRATLYAPKSADRSLRSLASLDKDVLRATLQKQSVFKGTGPIDGHIEPHAVEALSFEDLMARERALRVHFLQIDCEGYDWQLLRSIDIGKWKPEVINFESTLLPEADKKESRAWLETHGYTWFESGYDTCAYRFTEMRSAP